MPVFFILLAFTLSWLGAVAASVTLGSWAQGDPWRNYLVTAPGTWGVALAACLAALRAGGSAGVGALLAKLLPRGRDVPWILGLPPAGLAITWMAYALAGSPLPVGSSDLPIGTLIAHFVLQLLIVGIGEELGWRGWLLPRLRESRTLLRATALTAVIWLAWHLPKLLAPAAISVPLAVLILSSAVLLSVIWKRTDGSVLVAAIAHVSINAPVSWVEQAAVVSPDALLKGWAAVSVVYALIAITLIRTLMDPEPGSRRSGAGRPR
jgi:membrane protease YdiL (CAAX protease family)